VAAHLIPNFGFELFEEQYTHISSHLRDSDPKELDVPRPPGPPPMIAIFKGEGQPDTIARFAKTKKEI